MKNFHLIIATPKGMAFDGEAHQISLRGECGSLSVMANHIPFVTNVKAGECRIYTESGIETCKTETGLLSVTDKCVRLVTTDFTRGESEEK